MRIAFASHRDRPQGSRDDALAIRALSPEAEVVTVPWERRRFDWASLDAVVIRSCWNYHLELPAFLAWISGLDELGVRVVNPPRLVRWNADKRYLRELEAGGADIVPTRWIEAGEVLDLDRLLAETGWRKAVIKPTVGASSHQTYAIDAANRVEIEDRLGAGAGHGGFLLQPFLAEIVHQGEWSLIFFGGNFSHAVIKRARGSEFRVQSEFGGSVELQDPAPELIERAAGVLEVLPEPPVYARIDGVVRDDSFVLMELELIEPQLFFGLDPAAPARFARCLLEALGSSARRRGEAGPEGSRGAQARRAPRETGP